MPEFILFMHDDTPRIGGGEREADWGPYIGRLRATGNFQGGSAIGAGICARKTGAPAVLTARLTGYIRLTADDLAHAEALLAGNPVYEAGGTIEIRELPKTD